MPHTPLYLSRDKTKPYLQSQIHNQTTSLSLKSQSKISVSLTLPMASDSLLLGPPQINNKSTTTIAIESSVETLNLSTQEPTLGFTENCLLTYKATGNPCFAQTHEHVLKFFFFFF